MRTTELTKDEQGEEIKFISEHPEMGDHGASVIALAKRKGNEKGITERYIIKQLKLHKRVTKQVLQRLCRAGHMDEVPNPLDWNEAIYTPRV